MRHTRCALVTGVQTCALPIYAAIWRALRVGDVARLSRARRPARLCGRRWKALPELQSGGEGEVGYGPRGLYRGGGEELGGDARRYQIRRLRLASGTGLRPPVPVAIDV